MKHGTIWRGLAVPGGRVVTDFCPPCEEKIKILRSAKASNDKSAQAMALKELNQCARRECPTALAMQAKVEQAYTVSGLNFYSTQDVANLNPPPPTTPPPTTPPPAPTPVANLFESGTYGCGGCGLAGSSTVTASGSNVTILPGPLGVTSFTIDPTAMPPGSVAQGGNCTLNFFQGGGSCVILISCVPPGCSASCSLSPCP